MHAISNIQEENMYIKSNQEGKNKKVSNMGSIMSHDSIKNKVNKSKIY